MIGLILSRFALRGHLLRKSRSFVTIPDDGEACRPESFLHSREAPLMTVSNGRAPRSAVISSANLARSSRFRTTVKRVARNRSCTPERLR